MKLVNWLRRLANFTYPARYVRIINREKYEALCEKTELCVKYVVLKRENKGLHHENAVLQREKYEVKV